MTQRPDSKPTTRRFLSQRALLASGLSCLSGMSFLGSAGMVVAQTSTPSEIPAVPSATDLLGSPEPLPAPPEVVSVQHTAVDPQPVSEELAPAVAPPPVEAAPAEPLVAEPQVAEPQVAEPQVAEPQAAESLLSEPAPAAAPLVAPDLADKARSLGGGSTYIDSTRYDLGATTYQAPSAVVLSERSSGCEAVISSGEAAPGSVCARLQEAGSTGYVAQGQAPESGGSSYAGGYSSVNIGPVSLSSYGIGLSGRTTPAGRDYYNLTSRPPAKLGNGNIAMLFPLTIPAAITSVFGWRVHPISGESRFHSGTDIGADEGTPVLAAFEGEVQLSDFMGGYGLTVVLQHNKGTEETLYGHLSEIFVKPGEKVKQGEVIGRVGSTGFSTGPHLHFEFRQQTAEGSWVTMDPGQALEYSLAKFINGMQVAQTAKKPGLTPVVDPLQRLKMVLQEANQARLAQQPQPSVLPGLQPRVQPKVQPKVQPQQ